QLQANQQLLQQEINQLAALKTPATPGAASLAGSFPRSILIPGTDTSLAIGGYVKLDAFWWLQGGSPNGNVSASDAVNNYLNGVPLNAPIGGAFNPHSRGNGVFQFTARESRFHVETRTPTAWGPADTYLEIDFYGCSAGGLDCSNQNQVTNPVLPRLRLAYGTLGPWLAGQDWDAVNDLQAQPEMIDFGGEMGHFGYARSPQLRYTWAGPYGLSAIVAANQPLTQVIGPAGAFETDSGSVTAGAAAAGFAPVALAVNPTKNTLPDGNFVLGITQPWGHLRLNAILQDMELQDGSFISQNYLGYGGGFSGNVRPGWFGWAKDGFGFEAWAGSGLGHYANGTAGATGWQAIASNFGGGPAEGNVCGYGAVGIAPTAACAKFVHSTTFSQFGGQVNYAHYWLPNLRSTVVYGYQGQDVPSGLIGPGMALGVVNRAVWNATANLIWSPVAFVNIGLEYTYGQRETEGGARGNMQVIEGEFQVSF
ncbi:MAG TPA: hypothetical protein VM755_09950, partial [Stellaceae bacterium]|nr:hypothetical protein [Stellaceae bacterium]